MVVTHRKCGGLVVEDWVRSREYQREDGRVEVRPLLVCTRCDCVVSPCSDLVPDEMDV